LEFVLKRDPFVIIVIAMVVSLMLVFGLKMAKRGSLKSASSSSPAKSGLAPDFSLQSLDGKTVHLSDLRGKPVVLNFWATWCAPCKIEMPWFVDLQKKYAASGVQFLGIAMDDASTKDIAEFAQSMNVNYPILIGKEAVGDAYGGVQFLPETFYIDRDGKIEDKAFGLKGRGEIEDEVKKIIAK
jgi:peroxiredoxin